MPSEFPFSSEFHFLFPPFLMIYPQSLTAFGRKKSGNNDSGKIQCVCLTANTRHSRGIGVLLPRKIKSQQQPASHGAAILLTKTYKPDNVHRWIAPHTGQSTHAPSRGNCANSFTGKVQHNILYKSIRKYYIQFFEVYAKNTDRVLYLFYEW